ncbi:MAG TPA: hypothetical protein GXX40_04410 [Firmicutes bacterium]|nr:hypothetical protein [Bacillota bacterium]
MKLGGFLLLLLGLVLLGNTMGYVPWTAWVMLVLYWPVLLIAAGIELLVRRRISFGWLVALALLIVLVGGMLLKSPWAERIPGYYMLSEPMFFWFRPWIRERPERPMWPPDGPRFGPGEQTIREVLPPGVQRARYDIKLGAGRLKLGSATDMLIDGKISYSGAKPEFSYNVSGGEARVQLRHVERGAVDSATWDLSLNKTIPIAVRMDVGACDADLDMSELKVEELDLDMGASRLRVTFGDTGMNTKARIKAGASKIELSAPEAAGIRIRATSALSSNNFAEEGLTWSGGYWTSPNWGKPGTSLDIEVSAGVSSVVLRRV